MARGGLRPSAVDARSIDPGAFPVDAWELGKDSLSVRALELIEGWALRAQVLSRTLTLSGAGATIGDKDGYTDVLVTTGASDRTVVLPTAADNAGRRLHFLKVDTGAGKLILDGEGAELVGGFATYELWFEGNWAEFLCDGSTWHRVGGTSTVILPNASRAATPFINGSTTTSWLDKDCSSVTPVGIKSVILNCTLRFTGDGTLDTTIAYFKKGGDSTSTDIDLLDGFGIGYEDLTSGIDMVLRGDMTVLVDANRVFQIMLSQAGQSSTARLKGYGYE